MAQVYVSGPVDIWCGIGPGGTPLFLGHSRRAPRLSVETKYGRVECDLSGDVELDAILAGKKGRVTATLTRFNEGVLALIQDLAQSGDRGILEPGDIGTPMLEDNKAYQLWMRYPLAPRTFQQNAANGVCPPGFRMRQAFIDGNQDIEVGSSTPVMIQLTWTCLPELDISVANDSGQGRFTLFDTNMDDLVGIN